MAFPEHIFVAELQHERFPKDHIQAGDDHGDRQRITGPKNRTCWRLRDAGWWRGSRCAEEVRWTSAVVFQFKVEAGAMVPGQERNPVASMWSKVQLDSNFTLDERPPLRAACILLKRRGWLTSLPHDPRVQKDKSFKSPHASRLSERLTRLPQGHHRGTDRDDRRKPAWPVDMHASPTCPNLNKGTLLVTCPTTILHCRQVLPPEPGFGGPSPAKAIDVERTLLQERRRDVIIDAGVPEWANATGQGRFGKPSSLT